MAANKDRPIVKGASIPSKKNGIALTNGSNGSAKKASAKVPPPSVMAKEYVSQIACLPSGPLPETFVAEVRKLEQSLDAEVWLLIQNDGGPNGQIGMEVAEAFIQTRGDLPKERIALLINSPGGQAGAAFQIATVLQRCCQEFIAVVPRYAKSAATLLALGAKEILMGNYGELGPLDVQVADPDREDYISALDEVHAIQRLHAAAMEIVDQTMMLLHMRTRKKLETLLPLSLEFVAQMIRPMIENIDTVHYTQMSRALKVAEEYAVRLLRHHHPKEARDIARMLVENYPEHGFVIDHIEAQKIGIKLRQVTSEQERIFDSMSVYLNQLTAVGRIIEKPSGKVRQ